MHTHTHTHTEDIKSRNIAVRIRQNYSSTVITMEWDVTISIVNLGTTVNNIINLCT